jgi:hypothetical protein
VVGLCIRAGRVPLRNDQSAKAEVGVPSGQFACHTCSHQLDPRLPLPCSHTLAPFPPSPCCAPGVAHMMGKEGEHRLAQLRHEGTRVVPVFVLALAEHPADVVLSNRWEGAQGVQKDAPVLPLLAAVAFTVEAPAPGQPDACNACPHPCLKPTHPCPHAQTLNQSCSLTTPTLHTHCLLQGAGGGGP